MKRSLNGYLFEFLVAFTAIIATPVLAQTEGEPPEGDEAPAELVPPQLLEYVEAEYPAEAFAERIEAEVLAQLELDVEGNVVGVQIVEPAGMGFDEAAAAAMAEFKFAPALQNGEPTSALVLYRYRFFIEEDAPAPEEVPPLPAKLSGVVTDLEDAPVEGASVIATPASQSEEDESEAVSYVTGPDGGFVFESLIAGGYHVEVFAAGFKQYEAEEALEEGEARELIYRLETEASQYETVIRAERIKPPREVTRRTVTTREITMIPGTGGDALRAVQNLPGMALANFMGGELIIRGSSHADSVFFFDGMSAPLLYHFGGLTSIINSDLIESIDYYPGNFSVRYGRATGGVIDVNTKMPKTDGYHAYVEADLYDGGVLFEGRLSENWSLGVSARRSWVDGVLNAADAFGEVQMTVAPRYYDFQLVADYHPSDDDRLKLLFFGSDDRWEMTWDEDDPNWGAGLELHIWVYQAQAEWFHRFNPCWSNELSVAFGGFGITDNEGIMSLNWDAYPLQLRDELTFAPSERLALRIGTDAILAWGKLKAYVPGDIGVEGDQYSETISEQWYDFEGNRFYYYPALYAELDLKAIPRTQVVAGVRVDYFSPIDEWGFDPRLSVRYELFEKTTLKGGVGLFNQVPAKEYVDEDYGNPNLKPIRAMHYSLGAEQELFENVGLSVEGFYKDLWNVLVSSEEMIEQDGEMVPEHFASDGTGRVYGMELMLKHEPTERFFGWIAYTLMSSQRKDESGGAWRSFDYDQRHVLTAVGSLNLKYGFTAGFRFRLVSGTPTELIVGSSYDADQNEYYPIFSGNNAARTPTFHQLDIRVDKKWQWDLLALTVYLEVQNVYNRKNPAARIENYDYTEHGYVYDLPIFPNLGLRLEY